MNIDLESTIKGGSDSNDEEFTMPDYDIDDSSTDDTDDDTLEDELQQKTDSEIASGLIGYFEGITPDSCKNNTNEDNHNRITLYIYKKDKNQYKVVDSYNKPILIEKKGKYDWNPATDEAQCPNTNYIFKLRPTLPLPDSPNESVSLLTVFNELNTYLNALESAWDKGSPVGSTRSEDIRLMKAVNSKSKLKKYRKYNFICKDWFGKQDFLQPTPGKACQKRMYLNSRDSQDGINAGSITIQPDIRGPVVNKKYNKDKYGDPVKCFRKIKKYAGVNTSYKCTNNSDYKCNQKRPPNQDITQYKFQTECSPPGSAEGNCAISGYDILKRGKTYLEKGINLTTNRKETAFRNTIIKSLLKIEPERFYRIKMKTRINPLISRIFRPIDHREAQQYQIPSDNLDTETIIIPGNCMSKCSIKSNCLHKEYDSGYWLTTSNSASMNKKKRLITSQLQKEFEKLSRKINCNELPEDTKNALQERLFIIAKQLYDPLDSSTGVFASQSIPTPQTSVIPSQTSAVGTLSEDTSPTDTRSEDTSPIDTTKPSTSSDTRSEDTSPTDTRSEDTSPTDTRSEDTSPTDTRSEDTSPTDTRSEDTSPTDTRSEDTSPTDTRSEDTSPTDTRSEDTSPTDTTKPSTSSDTRSEDTSPTDTRSEDTSPSTTDTTKPLALPPSTTDTSKPIALPPSTTDTTKPLALPPSTTDTSKPIALPPSTTDTSKPLALPPSTTDTTKPLALPPSTTDTSKPLALPPSTTDTSKPLALPPSTTDTSKPLALPPSTTDTSKPLALPPSTTETSKPLALPPSTTDTSKPLALPPSDTPSQSDDSSSTDVSSSDENQLTTKPELPLSNNDSITSTEISDTIASENTRDNVKCSELFDKLSNDKNSIPANKKDIIKKLRDDPKLAIQYADLMKIPYTDENNLFKGQETSWRDTFVPQWDNISDERDTISKTRFVNKCDEIGLDDKTSQNGGSASITDVIQQIDTKLKNYEKQIMFKIDGNCIDKARKLLQRNIGRPCYRKIPDNMKSWPPWPFKESTRELEKVNKYGEPIGAKGNCPNSKGLAQQCSFRDNNGNWNRMSATEFQRKEGWSDEFFKQYIQSWPKLTDYQNYKWDETQQKMIPTGIIEGHCTKGISRYSLLPKTATKIENKLDPKKKTESQQSRFSSFSSFNRKKNPSTSETSRLDNRDGKGVLSNSSSSNSSSNSSSSRSSWASSMNMGNRPSSSNSSSRSSWASSMNMGNRPSSSNSSSRSSWGSRMNMGNRPSSNESVTQLNTSLQEVISIFIKLLQSSDKADTMKDTIQALSNIKVGGAQTINKLKINKLLNRLSSQLINQLNHSGYNRSNRRLMNKLVDHLIHLENQLDII